MYNWQDFVHQIWTQKVLTSTPVTFVRRLLSKAEAQVTQSSFWEKVTEVAPATLKNVLISHAFWSSNWSMFEGFGVFYG